MADAVIDVSQLLRMPTSELNLLAEIGGTGR